MDSNPGGRPSQGGDLLWLETYFILFPSKRRPTLTQVERALAESGRLRLDNLAADDDGLFASMLVSSPEDNAAVEVSYETGEAVIEQNLQWAKDLQKQLTPKQLQALITADARLDVAHFERVESGATPGKSKPTPRRDADFAAADDGEFGDSEFGNGDFGDGDIAEEEDFDADAALEVFDPTCLLTVVERLSKLTRGLALDPAAGEIV